MTWHNTPWPYKPDVVFEGGNAAEDTISPATMHSLSLLTTNYQPNQRLLTTSNATSAASALCARMAAPQIMAHYPDLWPETVKGLIVHSAEWTTQMESDFLDPRKRKEDYAKLIRHVGFGVTNIEQALWSLSNSLTLIVQDSLQPFHRNASKEPTARDMHLHRLPWPKEALEELALASFLDERIDDAKKTWEKINN